MTSIAPLLLAVLIPLEAVGQLVLAWTGGIPAALSRRGPVVHAYAIAVSVATFALDRLRHRRAR